MYGIDKDAYLVRLAKIHLACLGEDTKKIVCADSLIWNENLLGQSHDAFDVIFTNPPFGTNIQAGTEDTLQKFELAYKYRHKRNGTNCKTKVLNMSVPPQVVFIEQCLRLLKEGGKLGIVIPESMISNKKYSYVVDYMLSRSTIKAVIGMPDELFKTSGKGGTHTTTCLVILEKSSQVRNDYRFFMAQAKWCGHDSRGREIPKDDIPEIIQNYKQYGYENSLEETPLGFIVRYDEISNNVLAPRAYLYKTDTIDNDFQKTHYLISVGDLIKDKIIEISTGNEVGKLAYGTGKIPFVRTSDLSNWEIKSDPKHLVSEDIYRALAQKQDVRPGDILMVKDGSYLIGTCAIITEGDTKIVYQSHLYKIRVNNDNKYGINQYYLLAILSSEYLKQQIYSKTYSQDIINSLGDRLKDLVLPIFKDKEKIRDITMTVKRSIDSSIVARECYKKARAEVLA